MSKRIYILCPVRDASVEVTRELDGYVAGLESQGAQVHYPPRDVDQSDPVGLGILRAHRDAMREADEVHVFWTEKSEGSRFDLGMAFALMKPLVLINRDRVLPTHHKSFANVILALTRA